jgi:hypothetical protein
LARHGAKARHETSALNCPFGKLAYPMRGQATNRVLLGRKRHGRPGIQGDASGGNDPGRIGVCRFCSGRTRMRPVYQWRGTRGVRSGPPVRLQCGLTGWTGVLEIRLERGRDRSVLSGVVFTAVFSTDKFLWFVQRAPISDGRRPWRGKNGFILDRELEL